jgi:hypothetical protein
MHALALLGEQGGWPLTMFLTPAGEPFWGGTYFPKAAATFQTAPASRNVLREASPRSTGRTRQGGEERRRAAGGALNGHARPGGEFTPTLDLLDQVAAACCQGRCRSGQWRHHRRAEVSPDPRFSLLCRSWCAAGRRFARNAVVTH